ncbi:MAG: methyltransferase domain-containing protein [Alphaproteobacteria bacterium]
MAGSSDWRDISARIKQAYSGSGHAMYRRIWGANMHMGLFDHADEPLDAAMERSNERLADGLLLTADHRVLEVGCGFGGAALHLAERYGCHVVATDLSDDNLRTTRERAAAAGLAGLIEVQPADFHDLPFEDGSFDLWWSQEALLVAGDRPLAFAEAARVLRPGGHFVLSDIVMADATPDDRRAELLHESGCTDMWSLDRWRNEVEGLGLRVEHWLDLTPHMILSYDKARRAMLDNRPEMEALMGVDRLARSVDRNQRWIDGARQGWLGWGCLRAIKG